VHALSQMCLSLPISNLSLPIWYWW